MNKLYWRFQFGYWTGYLLLNLVYVRAWRIGTQGYFGTLLLLSLLLLATTHGLRWLYLRCGQQRSMAMLSLQLLWLLPLMAGSVQVLLAVLLWVAAPQQNLLTLLANRVASPTFIALSINAAIILLVWCVLCLLSLEWRRRQSAERAHWQNQIHLKELELQFLRSQINSHFLFNTLNNIRALVLEDAAAARQAMTDLAGLLRGILREGGSPMVSLREELEVVKGYLALEALQLEARLQSELDVHPSLLGARMPTLLLQTLVENAIRHGIARRSEGGCVRIEAQPISADKWRLQVTNPPAESAAVHAGSGIGLANTRERLTIAFGDQATLELAEGLAVVATVELPLWKS